MAGGRIMKERKTDARLQACVEGALINEDHRIHTKHSKPRASYTPLHGARVPLQSPPLRIKQAPCVHVLVRLHSICTGAHGGTTARLAIRRR
jgi:hypothetical protein